VMRRVGGSPAPAGQAAGQVEAGNIDLASRPKVKNADGSISTVRSMSFEEDGKEILVPTVSDDGRIMSEREAIDAYRKTGKHLGKFDTPENATAYAHSLHDAQESFYLGGKLSRVEFKFTDAASDTIRGEGMYERDPTGKLISRRP
jgi:hypothetical protein